MKKKKKGKKKKKKETGVKGPAHHFVDRFCPKPVFPLSRTEMVEAEAQGPAIRALGSLFKLTQVFLWCVSLSLALTQAKELVDYNFEKFDR